MKLSAAALAGLSLLWGGNLPAADKSGVAPSAISLPSGPGSIEGLGEAFQPTLNTGTAKYAVEFLLPNGPAGHAPRVSLHYEGGNGNGPVGFGWDLPVAFVQRQTDKGIPRYVDEDNQMDDDHDGQIDEHDERDVFINETKEELVPQADGTFFLENEGAFVRYQRTNDYWVGILPMGMRMEFGVSESARVTDETGDRVFRWNLERMTDTHGNTIVYHYESFTNASNLNQTYCAGISYGPGAPPWSHFHFVRFTYGDRSDWFEDGRAGFLVRTGKRLTDVWVGTQGQELAGHLAGDFNEDGEVDYLNRRYRLNYLGETSGQHWSSLQRVTTIGADGAGELPAALFDYIVCDPPETISAQPHWVPGGNEPPQVLDNDRVELVDLNSDGLPDMLRTEPFGGGHLGYLNEGELTVGDQTVLQWSGPRPVASEDGLAYNVTLESTGDVAHLADMDGDGLADLVSKSLVGDVSYYANLGSNGWARRRPMSILDFSPPSPFGQANVRNADIDFDKRVDVIESVDNGFGADYRIWFNLGDQRFSQRVFVPQASGFEFSDPGVMVLDFNGDRVPDVVRLRTATMTVTPGLGHGRFGDPVQVGLPSIVLDNQQLERVRLLDLTGDGLADLVLERASPGQLWYWINLGNYALSERRIVTGMPLNQGVNTAIRWADFNGNGTTDLLYADSTQVPKLILVDVGQVVGCVPRPHLLKEIRNGIGRTVRIQYASSVDMALADAREGRPWPTPLPFPVSVVEEVVTEDSLGNAYVTRYRYHDGYYDAEEKEFRGFARVEQIQAGDATAPTLVTTSRFDTGQIHEPLKGKLLARAASREDGAVFWEEETAWTDPPRKLRTGVNGQAVKFAHPLRTTRRVLELGEGEARVLESEFDYDAYGNRILEANYGIVTEGDRSAFDDERITETMFALNTDDWLVRYPMGKVVRDEHGKVISRQENYYDDPTFAGDNLGEVSAGDETLVKNWVNPDELGAYVLASRTVYDEYGNAVAFLDPLAGAAGGEPDLSQGHVREVTYDSAFATYPIRETIHVGQGKPALVFQATHDAGFGTTLTATDFNNHVTRYEYDVHGRLRSIIEPGDSEDFPTKEYDYALAVPVANGGVVNYVETRELDRPPGALGSDHRAHYYIGRLYVDGLGRSLASRTEAEPLPGQTAPRVAVSGAVLFNARMSVWKSLAPHFSANEAEDLDALLAFEDVTAPEWSGIFHEDGELVELDLNSAHAVSSRYDAMLRQLESTNPDGTMVRISYAPLAKASFDENDSDPASPHFQTPMVHVMDGLGRHIRTDEVVRLSDAGEDAAQEAVWSTHFGYDLNDRLTQITDSQGNVKRMTYDGLARLTFMDDPDRGVLEYAYDEASNVLETADARGQRIRFGYDGINRLVTEDYLDQGGPALYGYDYDPGQPLSPVNRPDVAYFYDVPVSGLDMGDGTTGTATDIKGRLAYVWDLSGEEHFSYDARGRVAWRVKRTVDPVLPDSLHRPYDPQELVSYRTQFAYDAMDRLVSLTYPDNDVVRMEYNQRAHLKRILGDAMGTLFEASNYLPAGDPSRLAYGNGVTTHYAFDRRYRMTALTSGQSQAAPELLDNGYVYDAVSNILSVRDHRPASVLSDGDPLRNHQEFEYDDLYRVRRVQYSFHEPSAPARNDGQIHYRYDRIGNMLSKTSSMEHEMRGYSVTDLGSMEYGGAAGAWGRLGRDQDAPGPHALTAVGEGAEARAYDYDANGNMRMVHGQTCTWDFRDRLVALEDPVSGQRTEYGYDYEDRRILKRIHRGGELEPDRIDTAVYVNQYFEIRGNGQPVKHVWNGGMRVARVTGSISNNARVQRIRLRPGWNLVSVAVDVMDARARLIQSGFADGELYRWNEATQAFATLSSADGLAAGDVVWVQVTRSGTWTVAGEYAAPSDRELTAGESVFVGVGLMAVEADRWLTGQGDAWRFDSGDQRWDAQLTSIMGWQSTEVTGRMLPGGAAFIRVNEEGAIGTEPASSEIHYFHGDHLTSSAVVTDRGGAVVEQQVFYPFGETRQRRQAAPRWESYGFIQKEKDVESGLHYVESRYLSSYLGRFGSVDPTLVVPDELDGAMLAAILATPQALNLYAYSYNRPVNHLDPSGNYGVNIELGYSGGVGLGTSGGIGIMIDSDRGLMFYKTYGAGLHAGADVGAGVTLGGYADGEAFFGRGTALGAGYGKIGGDVSYAGDDPSWDSFNGISGSIGPSIGIGNVHGRATKTEEIWTNKRHNVPRMVPSQVRHKEVHKPQLQAGPVQIQEPVVVTKGDVRKGIMDDRRAQWRAEQLKKQNEIWRQTRDAAYYKRIIKSSETLNQGGDTAANPEWSRKGPDPDDSMFE